MCRDEGTSTSDSTLPMKSFTIMMKMEETKRVKHGGFSTASNIRKGQVLWHKCNGRAKWRNARKPSKMTMQKTPLCHEHTIPRLHRRLSSKRYVQRYCSQAKENGNLQQQSPKSMPGNLRVRLAMGMEVSDTCLVLSADAFDGETLRCATGNRPAR